MNPNINDVVNDDGTVTRTITITRIYTAEQYQALQTNLTNQVATLQGQLNIVATNLMVSQNNLALKKTITS